LFGHLLFERDDFVEELGDLAVLAGKVDGQAHGEVAAPEGAKRGQEHAASEAIAGGKVVHSIVPSRGPPARIPIKIALPGHHVISNPRPANQNLMNEVRTALARAANRARARRGWIGSQSRVFESSNGFERGNRRFRPDDLPVRLGAGIADPSQTESRAKAD